MTTRTDPRYVASNSPQAVLRAWAGADAQNATMDMGGWTDGDETSFMEAILSELRYGYGPGTPPIPYITIETR